MSSGQMEVRVALFADDLDTDALAECVAMLAEELAELDVDRVDNVAIGDAPTGAKGVDLMAVGALVVKLAASGKVLARLVDAVRDWLSRNDAGHVRMEIDGDVLEVTGASPAERTAMIAAWVQRHSES